MIRRQKSMRFLGGFYAFPGGKVDPDDGGSEILGRCHGITRARAERLVPPEGHLPALAFWVAAARELLEETGVLPACDASGRPVVEADPGAAGRIEALRAAHMAKRAPLPALLAAEGWHLDLGSFRYLSHFITPPSSPIRFTARFFLAPVPPGQSPRLFAEEASEGFWVEPSEGFRRHRTGYPCGRERCGRGSLVSSIHPRHPRSRGGGRREHPPRLRRPHAHGVLTHPGSPRLL